jgi:hypothetical protein
MALNLGSPGVSIKEIDLTQGAIQGVVDITGAIAGPFEKGPVDVATPIASEAELLQVFGNPSKEDNQYEYFLSASQYLSYGGNLQVVRVSGGTLSNANAPVGAAVTNLLIKNFDDYLDNHTGDTEWYYASRTPGTHANGMKVCTIDAFADQIVAGINTSGIVVGAGVTQSASASVALLDGTVGTLDGYYKGLVTDLGVGEVSVKFVSHVSSAGTETRLEYTEAGPYEFKASTAMTVGGATGAATTTLTFSSKAEFGSSDTTHGGLTQILLYDSVGTTTIDNAGGASVGTGDTAFYVSSSTGITTNTLLIVNDEIIAVNSVDGNYIGLGTDTSSASANRGQVGTTTATHTDGSTVRIVGQGTTTGTLGLSGLAQGALSGAILGNAADYTVGDIVQLNNEFLIVDSTAETSSLTPTSVRNWYDEQIIELDNSSIYWRSIAPKPRTTSYGLERGARNDEIHIAIVDDSGSATGNAGTIVEKWIGLSKASDATRSSKEGIYYKDVIRDSSGWIFAAASETGAATGFSSGLTALGTGAGAAGQLSSNVTSFHAAGSKVYTLGSAYSYSGTTMVPGYNATLAELVSGYSLFSNEELPIDFLLMGPSMSTTRAETQAKANKLVAIANERKDCMACISPYRGDVVGNANGSTDITDKILQYYAGITHSSYAVFDSGYKYTFDRFTNSFVYVPTSADIAGIMARTNSINFPWYSPAGSSRGALNNVIKLAYNPTQGERDRLYAAGVNPIITTRGQGTILFGDKTALGTEGSAFTRINVRRLFLFVEEAISRFSRSSLFEFNDSVTRSNFVNIVDPFLRDIQAKRGISEFRLICDETNNTPDVIDRNEFRADIYIQPARSVNYVSLTFVASATGASFIESSGS